jgi:GST-like protein
MVHLYFWPTPNGKKISIMLEETKVPYTIVPVNIGTWRAVPPGVSCDQSEQPHARNR